MIIKIQKTVKLQGDARDYIYVFNWDHPGDYVFGSFSLQLASKLLNSTYSLFILTLGRNTLSTPLKYAVHPYDTEEERPKWMA